MKNKIIIDENKKYLKGNLHVHTNASDGKYSVEEVCQKYGSMGYDFLAITDHNVVYKGSNFVNGMLVVPGVEVACTYKGEIDYKKGSYSHFNLIGILSSEYDIIYPSLYNNVDEINLQIKKFQDKGILVQYNHPNFSRFSDNEYFNLNCFDMIEIYNHKDYTMETCLESADAIIRNYLFRGKRFMISCGDDYHGNHDNDLDFYCRKSFVMVNADLNIESVVNALAQGDFYVSNGPLINDLRIIDNVIYLKTEKVRRVFFYNFTRRSKHLYNFNGFTECSYEIKGDERYIFIKIVDMDGNNAWVQPIYVN